MNLIWFLVVVVVVVILISVVWQAFGVSTLFASMTPTQRLLWALLGLLIIIAIVWYFFFAGHLVTFP
jgi:hypothetical protein